MDIRIIKRLSEIATIQHTLQNIKTVEWVIKYYTDIMNGLEDALYPLRYEINDNMFRLNIQCLIKQILNQAKYMNMIYDFSIICDETNNSVSIIDSNNCRIDIAIKPLIYINEWIYIPISFK